VSTALRAVVPLVAAAGRESVCSVAGLPDSETIMEPPTTSSTPAITIRDGRQKRDRESDIEIILAKHQLADRISAI
jgi:hypothetical protein